MVSAKVQSLESPRVPLGEVTEHWKGNQGKNKYSPICMEKASYLTLHPDLTVPGSSSLITPVGISFLKRMEMYWGKKNAFSKNKSTSMFYVAGIALNNIYMYYLLYDHNPPTRPAAF